MKTQLLNLIQQPVEILIPIENEIFNKSNFTCKTIVQFGVTFIMMGIIFFIFKNYSKI